MKLLVKSSKLPIKSLSFAEEEFKALGYKHPSELPEDDINRMMQENVFELLEVFGKQGHSGFSAPYAIHYFSTLAKQEPLAPLTGEDWEWVDVARESGHTLWQNKRCSGVFKRSDGLCYYLDGKVFREPNGVCYTNKDSRVPVVFPYTPKTEYIDVPYSAGVKFKLPKGGADYLAMLRNNSDKSWIKFENS